MAASAYTQEQVSHYLDYVDFPRELRSGPRDLHFLTVLHAHQISKIPYDNLSLHYNASHSNNLDPALLYDKFTRNGRGGYCMETTVFFRHILRALGFNVYSAGARIRMRKDGVPHGPFSGWRHCTNIVTFEDGQKYSTDVGFGGDGPVRPLPLVKTGGSTPNLGSQEVRLRWGPLPDSTDPINQQFWIYEYRNSPSQDWNPYYAFPELEFFQPDFMILNYYTSVHPDSFQRHMPLVIRFIRDGPQIVGKIMLAGDKVKRNMGGRTETLLECKTEAERVQALEEYLGVTLTPEQVEGIKGFRTELVSGNGQRAPPIL